MKTSELLKISFSILLVPILIMLGNGGSALAQENLKGPLCDQLVNWHNIAVIVGNRQLSHLTSTIKKPNLVQTSYDLRNKKNRREQGSVIELTTAGLLWGTAGFLVGGYVGSRSGEPWSDYEYYQLERASLGAVIGEATLMPVGIHLANRRQGSFPLVFLTSVGVAGADIIASISAARRTHNLTPLILISLTPLLQLVTCMEIERKTGAKSSPLGKGTSSSQGTISSGKQKKNPAIPVLLSPFIPSAGHAYAGNWRRGLVFTIGRIGCWIVAFGAGFRELHHDHYVTYYKATPVFYLGTASAVAIAIWETIDAQNEVSSYNRRLDEDNTDCQPSTSNLGFNIVPRKNGIGLNLTYSF